MESSEKVAQKESSREVLHRPRVLVGDEGYARFGAGGRRPKTY